MKLEDIINGNGTLSDKEVRFLKKKKYKITMDTPDRIKYDLRVINFNIVDDTSIKILSTIYSEAKQRTFSTPKSVKELHDKLVKLGKKNMSLSWRISPQLSKINPEFLFYTDDFGHKDVLINNYDLKEKAFKLDCSDEQKERLYNNLIKSNFVLNSENRLLIIQESAFLFASLNNNFGDTMEFLKQYNYMPLIFLDEKDHKRFDEIIKKNGLEEIVVESYDWFVENLNDSVENGMIGFMAKYDWTTGIEEGNNQEYNWFLNVFNYLGNTPTFVSEELIRVPYVFKKLVPNEEERAFIEEVMWTRKNYTKEDEVRLLKLLKSSESKIENVISDWVKKDLKRSDLSVLEIYAIGFYQKKYLNENGLNDVLVNCFKFSKDAAGVWSTLKKSSYVYNDPSSFVKEMIKTILHESTHALQENNIVNMDFYRDEDIDIYSKDMLLRRLVIQSKGEDQYYEENYYNITYEKDADFVGNLERNKIFEYEEDFQVHIFDGTSIEMFSVYNLDLQRTYEGKVYDIHELTEKFIKEFVVDEEMLKIYPLLDYEYVLNKDGKEANPHQKSIKELCNCLVCCEDDKTKNIYRYLISRRLNPRVYKNFSSHVNELESLSNSENEEMRKEALEILKENKQKEEAFDNSDVEIKNYLEDGKIVDSRKLKIRELKEKIRIYRAKIGKTLSEQVFQIRMNTIFEHFQYAHDKIKGH